MINWDYRLTDDWKPATQAEWEWYLVRKINYDDFSGLDQKTLRCHFPNIKALLDPGKRAMFEHFLIDGTH